MRKKNISLTFFLLLLVIATAIFLLKNQTPSPSSPLRIACLIYTTVDSTTISGLQAGLDERGYEEGKTIHYSIYGPVNHISELPALASDIVQFNPDLIFVSSTPATIAIKEATKNLNIPVIFAPVNDPVGSGIVKSLTHPGGHITGIKLATDDAHRLRLLTEFSPDIANVFVPYSPNDKSAEQTLANITPIAEHLGLQLFTREIIDIKKLPLVLQQLPDEIQAIFLPRDSMIESQITTFHTFALERSLPLSAPSSLQVGKGALFSYGHNHFQLGRQAARLSHQVFQGISPKDLPVEDAQSFFDINLNTAKEIGLNTPEELLRRADHRVY